MDSFIYSETCSGNGIRISSTALFPSYCLCNDGYTGQADYFDLRIVVPNVTGHVALDCPVSDLGVYILWGAVLAAAVFHMILGGYALWKKYKYFQQNTPVMQRTFKKVRSYLPFQCLILDSVG